MSREPWLPASEAGRDAQALLGRAAAAPPRPIATETRHRLWFRIAKETQAHAAPRRPRWAFAVPALAAVAAAIAFASVGRQPPPAASGRVVELAGQLEVRRGDRWTAVPADEPLPLPMRLRSGAGAASTVRLTSAVDLEVRGATVLSVAAREVVLESGEVFSRVRPGGGRFVVRIGDASVVVHGTEFWTARAGTEASVCLLRGQVEVVGPAGRLAWLEPGQGWRSSDRAPGFPGDLPCGRAAPPAEAPKVAAPVASTASPAPARARREPSPVAEAPAPVATADPASTLAEENALYRLGVARRRGGDARGALDAWREYQRRFPGGVLAEEVDLAMLETELGQGSPSALDAAERYLVLWPASTHAPDVHGLYGALLHRANRPAEALAEYERALRGRLSASRRDEALWGRADCLDRLGRAEEAKSAYRAYLAERPDGRFVDRARAALAEPDGAR